MVCFHLLHWNPSLGPFLHSQLISHHPPTWAQLLHQRQPCLLIYTALILSPTLQLGDFPLLSHVSLSEGCVSPSPESPLLLPLVSCLFHHRTVWSCPLFLSKQFLLSWGMSPLLLPSSLPLPGKPAVLPSLTLALAGAPWPQCRDLPPLPPFSTSSGALCVPLSQQLTDPHCKRDSAQAGPGTMLSGLRGGTHRLPEDFSLGGMALSVWESLECPVSAWLWKFWASQKRGLSESHTATPLVRSHLVLGSVESRGPSLLTWLPKSSLLLEAGSNHTLLEVLKCFDSCYGMSYFQLVQEADVLKSQKKASLFILYFWLRLEVECQKSIVSHLL